MCWFEVKVGQHVADLKKTIQQTEIKSTFTSGEHDTSENLQAAQCLECGLMLHIWVGAKCRVLLLFERDKNRRAQLENGGATFAIQ